MIARFKKAYAASPDSIKRLIRIVPFEYRMGKVFRRTLRMIDETDYLPEGAVRKLQEGKLGELLELAIRRVPAFGRYRRLLGKSPFDILREIEPVTKKQMQKDFDLFVSTDHGRIRHHETYTGGSSGHALKFLLDDRALEIEWAFMIAQWMRAGYRLGDKRAAFRGVEFRTDREARVRGNPVYDEILMSPFDLTDDALAQYVDSIRKFKPRFIRGYPSAISVLATFLENSHKDAITGIQAVLCGSEGILDWQRELIGRVFGCRVYSWYGMTEKVVLAGECENSTDYHAFPQYGITEVVDSRGNVTSQPGDEGEIVGTGFINTVMPFIRYRLDDTAQIAGNHCSSCGRHHLLLSNVTGHRVQDVIVGKSGSRISMTALNMHDDTFAGVSQFQFRQSTPGKVTLLLKASAEFNDERRNLIVRALERKTRSDIDYDIQLVDRIPSSEMGKGVYLKQDLPLE